MSAKGMIFSVFFSLCSGCFSSGNPNTADMPDSVSSCLGDKHEEFVSCHGAGYLPYYTVDPIPPLDAVLNNVKGYVVMEFLVDEKGVPKKIKVVESHPDGVFDRAAIDALSQFRYEAPVVNDQPQAVRGVLYKIEFNNQQD